MHGREWLRMVHILAKIANEKNSPYADLRWDAPPLIADIVPLVNLEAVIQT